jgi:ABC-type dipeptide/oligopeptide/nickel transport system permease subunit
LTDLAAPKLAASLDAATDEAVGLTAESISPRKQAYIRFTQHKAAVASVFVLALFVLFVVLSPITARYGINEPIFKISEGKNQNLSPRSAAWFGTDSIGRDVFSRLIYGVRVSLLLGLASGVFAIIIGIGVGAVAGLRGGWFDDIMMRMTDIFLAFPILVSLMVTRNFLSQVPWLEPIVGDVGSIRFLVILFALFGWMAVARLVRAQVLALKEREFVEASRAIGASNWHIIKRHLLPNSVGPILVSLSFAIVGSIVAESTLALFGYGPQPGENTTSLGPMVSESRTAVPQGNWWLALFPFLCLLLITLCISFIGDGLRDATDPKSSQSRA